MSRRGARKKNARKKDHSANEVCLAPSSAELEGHSEGECWPPNQNGKSLHLGALASAGTGQCRKITLRCLHELQLATYCTRETCNPSGGASSWLETSIFSNLQPCTRYDWRTRTVNTPTPCRTGRLQVGEEVTRCQYAGRRPWLGWPRVAHRYLCTGNDGQRHLGHVCSRSSAEQAPLPTEFGPWPAERWRRSGGGGGGAAHCGAGKRREGLLWLICTPARKGCYMRSRFTCRPVVSEGGGSGDRRISFVTNKIASAHHTLAVNVLVGPLAASVSPTENVALGRLHPHKGRCPRRLREVC